jgi:hypothetical protein
MPSDRRAGDCIARGLLGVAGGMKPAIAIVPLLCGSLRTSGSSSDDVVRSVLTSVLRELEQTPPEWLPMLAELSLSPTRDMN